MESFRFILNGFCLWKRVTFRGEHPEETSFKLVFSYLRAIGLWPSKPSEDSYSYTIFNAVMMMGLLSFVATITCDLYEASSDFVKFGDDLCVLVGLYLILFKTILYRIYKPNIKWIIDEYECLQQKFSTFSEGARQIQRHSFIQQIFVFYTYVMLGNFLFVAVGFQPLFSGQSGTLPFRAKFPFSVEGNRTFVAVYIFQCICTLINIKTIVYIDNTGCVFIDQTSVNLRIITQRIRDLSQKGMNRDDLREIVGDHQRIIRLIDYINEYYYLNFVAQIAASTFLICLTAFESHLAHDQPLVALKFQIYMLSSFLQLLYWCWAGNRVRFDSMEIATAAYECDWLSESKDFRRDLAFLIQRAQKPLTFRAPPFYGYDFHSFASILSSSYSYFTLLRTLND